PCPRRDRCAGGARPARAARSAIEATSAPIASAVPRFPETSNAPLRILPELGMRNNAGHGFQPSGRRIAIQWERVQNRAGGDTIAAPTVDNLGRQLDVPGRTADHD